MDFLTKQEPGQGCFGNNVSLVLASGFSWKEDKGSDFPLLLSYYLAAEERQLGLHLSIPKFDIFGGSEVRNFGGGVSIINVFATREFE